MLKKLNLLRVPPEVELDGLDMAEYAPDIHVPEFAWAEDLMIEPDGSAGLPRSRSRTRRTRSSPGPERRPHAPRAREEDLMPAIIDSAPAASRVTPGRPTRGSTDSADFILADPWQDCAGIMTFGPGSTYGPDGVGAETSYMVLTWIGIVVMVVVLIGWVVYENRRLVRYASARVRAGGTRRVRSRRGGGDGVAMNGKQIEFPPKQTHVKVVRVRDVGDLHRARYRRPGDRASARTSATSSDPLSELDPQGRRPATAAPPRTQPATRGGVAWAITPVVRALTRPSSGSPSSSACSALDLLRRQGLSEQPDQDHAGRRSTSLAQKQVDFEPENTQIRLLRQGLNRHPYWVVSLVDPVQHPRRPAGVRELAVVRIDATNGEVASVQDQGGPDNGDDKAGGNQKEP